MGLIEQLSAIILLIDFLVGLVCGVAGGAIHGSKCEDRERTLLGAAPDPFSAGARVLYGLYTRDDGYLQSLLTGGGTAGSPEADDIGGPPGQGLDR